MDIIEYIFWDMTQPPKTALLWDCKRKDYRLLLEEELNQKLNKNMIIRCPLDIYSKTMDVHVKSNESISDLLDKLYCIYSGNNTMEGYTYFKGLSEIDFPYYYLNVSI